METALYSIIFFAGCAFIGFGLGYYIIGPIITAVEDFIRGRFQ